MRTFDCYIEDHLRPLMIRSLEGDDAANRKLLSALGRHLRGYFARRIGAGASEIEDLVQETLLRQRSLLEGVKFHGLSIKEAAEKRGVTAVSARVMLHRILKWLYQAWHDENGKG